MSNHDLSGSEAQGSLASLGRVHFIGVGGVGMSAVARIMVARGVPVSGSDAKDLPVMRDLATKGARIAVGYDAGNLGAVSYTHLTLPTICSV